MRIEDHESEVVGEVTVAAAGNGVVLRVRLHHGSRLFGSGFERSYEFQSRADLHEVLGVLHHRAADPAGGRPLKAWPHRPFAWMRRGCRFIGTIRGIRSGKCQRVLAFAVVPKAAGEVLEVSDWAGGESAFNLPIRSLGDIRDLL